MANNTQNNTFRNPANPTEPVSHGEIRHSDRPKVGRLANLLAGLGLGIEDLVSEQFQQMSNLTLGSNNALPGLDPPEPTSDVRLTLTDLVDNYVRRNHDLLPRLPSLQADNPEQLADFIDRLTRFFEQQTVYVRQLTLDATNNQPSPYPRGQIPPLRFFKFEVSANCNSRVSTLLPPEGPNSTSNLASTPRPWVFMPRVVLETIASSGLEEWIDARLRLDVASATRRQEDEATGGEDP